jgi:hypothetical protein
VRPIFRNALGIAVLKEFPDWTMPGVTVASQFAEQVVGKLTTDEREEEYRILHAWVVPQTTTRKGQVLALCEKVRYVTDV